MSSLVIKSLYKKKTSRQTRCVSTSNRHVNFLSLPVTCYKCCIARNVQLGSAATGEVKTSTDSGSGNIK